MSVPSLELKASKHARNKWIFEECSDFYHLFADSNLQTCSILIFQKPRDLPALAQSTDCPSDFNLVKENSH